MIEKSFIRPKRQIKPTAAESRCKMPCKKMTNKVSLRLDGAWMGDQATLTFRFKKTVRVEKKVVVYTWFNFIIDVGSSLGLWLGLSALGITDLAIKAFFIAKTWLIVRMKVKGKGNHGLHV